MDSPPGAGGPVVPRRREFRLEDERRELRDVFRSFLSDGAMARVRAAEPSGFDEELWTRLNEMRTVAMAAPEAVGGDGAELVDLVIVAEELGRALAPAPVIEAMVASRVLTSAGDAARELLERVLVGDVIATVAPAPVSERAIQLVPAGAVATVVLALDGDELVALRTDTPPVRVDNLGHAPYAWWDLRACAERVVLVAGSRAKTTFNEATRVWMLLMGAAQVGIAAGALEIAVDHAKNRHAFGAPIGSYQAIAHPLADCYSAELAARRFTWQAAWLAEHEPLVDRHLVPMSYLAACEAASLATTVAVHTLGGLGFTTESDVQRYFRRAKGWAAGVCDPTSALDRVAFELYGTEGTKR